MFHQLDSLSPQEVADDNVRTFTADGTAVLRVPGLRDLPTRVRVGRTELPLRITAAFVDNRLNGQKVASDLPMVSLTQDADGTPILLRSLASNDGLWQKGEPVHVWGDWEPDAAKAVGDPKKAAK